MDWVLSDPSNHKFGHADQHSLFKWKWYIRNQTSADPGSTEKYIGKYPKCLCPLHLIYYLLPPSPHLWTHRAFPVTSWIRKKKLEETWAWCTDGSAWYVAPSKCFQQYHCIPFWNIPTRQYTCIVVSELLAHTPWEAISFTRAQRQCTIYFAF